MKFLYLWCVLLFIGFISSAAHAEGRCPPGYYPIGGKGVLGCAPIPGYGSSSSEHRSNIPEWNSEGMVNGVLDFYQARIRRLQDWEKRGLTTREKMLDQNLVIEPKDRDMIEGKWQYIIGSEQGKDCTALWSNLDGFITLSGPGRETARSKLVFMGANIPKPEKPMEISVELRQSKSPPQIVKAGNFTLPGVDYGLIMFDISPIERLLDSFPEIGEFEVMVNNKRIVKNSWTGGIGARDWLRQCTSKGK